MSLIDGLIDRFKYKTYTEKYVAGFTDIKGPRDITITFKEGFIQIETVGMLFKKRVTLRPENIVEVSLDQQNFRHAGKAAAGAIIGGVLTGGIGLIAGAAMGGKRRTENKLVLTVNTGSRDFDVFINPSNTTTKLYTEFINFISRYEKPYVEIKEPAQIQQAPVTPQLNDTTSSATQSLTDQLERLHSLMEKGILTKEEFEEQKRKLLQA